MFFRKVFSGQSKLKKTLKEDAFYFEILGIDVGPSWVFLEEFIVMFENKKINPKSMLYILSFYASKLVHLRFF